MHSCSVIEEPGDGLPGGGGGPHSLPGSGALDGGSTLVAIAALVTEGRMPSTAAKRAFTEGPHCAFSKQPGPHVCSVDNQLCMKYEKINSYVLSLWQKNIPLCIQVLLVPKCCCPDDLFCDMSSSNLEQIGSAVLLEEWHVNVLHRRTHDLTNLNINQLINAIRSQLYFSQITAWLASPDETIRKTFPNNKVVYCLTVPGETYGCKKFASNAQQHNFPLADIGNGIVLKVSLSNLPRSEEIPHITCSKCDVPMTVSDVKCNVSMLDDRMQTYCTLKGKHHCEDYEDYESCGRSIRLKQMLKDRKTSQNNSENLSGSTPSTSRTIINNNNNKPSTSTITPGSSSQHNLDIKSDKAESSKVDLELSKTEFNEVLSVLKQNGPKQKKNDLKNKADILLDAIMRPSKMDQLASKKETNYNTFNMYQKSRSPAVFLERNKRKCVHKSVLNHLGLNEVCVGKMCDKISCDKNDSTSDNIRISNDIYVDINCDTVKRKKTDYKMRDISNVFSVEYIEKRQKVKVKQKITFEEDQSDKKNLCDIQENKEKEEKCSKTTQGGIGIPSASDQAKFRKNLDSAASMVFHSRTGLPLTSSPAPVRRGKSCFDFDSSINSVSAIRSALFSLAPNCSTDDDSESDCSIVSPCSPDAISTLKQCKVATYNYHRRGQTAGLLGNFEESVLNGRLEPVSTVHGFTAELGASGSFCPRHVVLPVTVFFYTLGDNDKVSTPYLGHINLGKKGYNVPKSGTIQVTLFNPLGTVVKMFVIMYDLSDMPPNSQTFIRQRTLYMPANLNQKDVEWSQKWLRYLVHLRFMSSKSGRIYLHSDIRMIICRKSDLDTATAHGIDMSYELRSFTHSPTNPKFSPRK